MDFTGERWIFQEGQDSLIQREHMARYDYACSLTKGKQVLDIASGSGFGAHLLKTKGQAAKVVGGDIDSQSVEYANKNYAAQDLLYVEADAQNMPFSDEQFEVVVSYETIEHLPDYEAYLKQISRVMTKDGVALISTPDKDNYGLYNLGKPNPYHVHEFTRQEFVDVLKKYFSQVELQGQCSIDKQQWQAMQSKDHAKQKLKAVDRFGVLKKTKSVAKKVLGKNSLPSIHDKLVADLEPLSTDKDYVYMVATCRK